MNKELRKHLSDDEYCPDCCGQFNPDKVEGVEFFDNIEGTIYCGKCKREISKRAFERTNEEQRRWVEEIK